MWQAYYGKERVRLFGLLVTTLREQYHYPWTTAAAEGFHLARAAAPSATRTGGTTASCPISRGTRRRARWQGAGFDPGRVARAELAWWVARRTKGRNDPEQVGRLIAEEYALLYEAPFADMLTAGLLRAEAAAMREREAARRMGRDRRAAPRFLRQTARAADDVARRLTCSNKCFIQAFE